MDVTRIRIRPSREKPDPGPKSKNITLASFCDILASGKYLSLVTAAITQTTDATTMSPVPVCTNCPPWYNDR